MIEVFAPQVARSVCRAVRWQKQMAELTKGHEVPEPGIHSCSSCVRSHFMTDRTMQKHDNLTRNSPMDGHFIGEMCLLDKDVAAVEGW